MRWKAILTAMAMTAGAVYLSELPAAVPKPRAIPQAWQLDFAYLDLQAIRLKLPGQDKPQTFWYMRYTVTNRTGEDQFLVPDISLYTDTGDLRPSGRDVPRAVFEHVKTLHNDPLLRAPAGMIGKLLQGEDNTKHGVGYWPDFDGESEIVDIFIGGLSGENVQVPLPKPLEIKVKLPKGEEKVITKTTITLSKTLQLRYKVSGGEARYLNPPTLVSAAWVMR